MVQPAQPTDHGLSLRFWGVRGSVPTPVPHNLGYGGNTPCVSVLSSAGDLLVFDAGSGIRSLGAQIMAKPHMGTKVNLFFTHFHWDHLQGLPFFMPVYRKDVKLVIHSEYDPEELRSRLARQMVAPFFPVDWAALPSQIEYRRIGHAPLSFGDVTVQGFPLNHPQGAQGYRIATPGKSIVFATDYEHGNPQIDANLRKVAEGADVLIYDAQYTPAEYEQHRGWGHSTWQEAVRVACDAQVKKLVLYHHDPDHHDAALDGILAEAQQHYPHTIAAREGHTV